MTNWPYVKSKGRENRKKEIEKRYPHQTISPLTLTMALSLVREDNDEMNKNSKMEKSFDSKSGSFVNKYE